MNIIFLFFLLHVVEHGRFFLGVNANSISGKLLNTAILTDNGFSLHETANLTKKADSNTILRFSLSMHNIEEYTASNLYYCKSENAGDISLNIAKVVGISALLARKVNRFKTILGDVVEKGIIFEECKIPNFNYLMRSAIAINLEDRKADFFVEKGKEELTEIDLYYPSPGIFCNTGLEKLGGNLFSTRLLRLVVNSSISDERYVLEYLFSLFEPSIIGMLLESVEFLIEFLSSTLPLLECPINYEIMKELTVSNIVARDRLHDSLHKLNDVLYLASAFVQRSDYHAYASFLHYFSTFEQFKQKALSSDIQNERLLVECKYLEARSNRAVSLLKHVSYSQLKKAFKRADKAGWKKFAAKKSKKQNVHKKRQILKN